MNILLMVKEARKMLRSTTTNWQEQCLFECDDILTAIIGKTAHKDSGERCLVLHLDFKGNRLPQCIKCSNCKQWLRQDEFENGECPDHSTIATHDLL